ncbi:L,D-transpeptidase family protein [Trichlorobacter sp.]|uniref:L,D-transpeptidase family protein n=1 Tax=Trichlorobacter sp. TaxID=2911007 RepID=UPI002A36175F|nr:L,D-transpeptidase family protein [Trichlorobacter sp.]MDY0385362.1 L,D-transpeptidase family protein [Trichlorobacter sp.]
MRELKWFQKTTGSKQCWFAGLAPLARVCSIVVPLLLCSCGGLNNGFQARDAFREANNRFNRGEYSASLGSYQQIIEQEPEAGDRALFEMGIIHAHPGNGQKDYQKAQDCFQQLLRDYPESAYRKDSQLMLFNISTVMAKDSTIATQQAQIEALRQELHDRSNERAALQKTITALEQELKGKQDTINALQAERIANPTGPADRILIEKKARRLTLFARGKELKSYPIALGGNPNGPKERQGDNKTPEGIYRIESRNRNSSYHLALRISYPNERDKKRAKELGVSPGGDIMIHGIKNGFSWVGGLHTEADWTQGCIAVTNQEIEEIEKLVPNGTTVEIRP